MHPLVEFLFMTWYLYPVAIIATYLIMGEQDYRRDIWNAERKARERARSILRSVAAGTNDGNRRRMARRNVRPSHRGNAPMAT
jgi:hypothetical protein